MPKKLMVLALIVITILSASAVGISSAQEPLKIGVLTDQSGALAIYGFEQTNGFELGLAIRH